ncbi:MAG: hypothetical protein ACI4SF_15410 [Oscillospiraceae bacterium]
MRKLINACSELEPIVSAYYEDIAKEIAPLEIEKLCPTDDEA